MRGEQSETSSVTRARRRQAAGVTAATAIVALVMLLRGCLHDPAPPGPSPTPAGPERAPVEPAGHYGPPPTVRTIAATTGAVLDDLTGAPVPEALVEVGDRREQVATDGTFSIAPMPDGTTLHIAADGYADAEVTVANTQPLAVRLQRARGVSIRLIEAGAQTPVPEFEASLLTLPSDDLSAAQRLRRVPLIEEARQHTAGWAWFREAPPGRYVVWCQPTNGEHVAPLPEVIEWHRGHGRFVLEAAPAQTLTVRVRKADGSALAKALDVLVVRVPDGMKQDDDYRELSVATLRDRASNHPFEHRPVVVSAARTAAEGLAAVTVPQWQTVTVIVVDGEMTLRAVAHLAAAQRTAELLVTLPPGVTVKGRTTPAALVGAIHPECAEFLQAAGLDEPGDLPHPSVVAVRQDAPTQETWQARLDRDGDFGFPHLPAGQWQLYLSYHLVNGPGSFQHRTATVGEYAWWNGGEQQVVIDASQLVPRRIDLACHDAGVPVAQRGVEVRSPASPHKAAEGRTDAAGTISLRIEPGRYVLQCRPVQGAKLHQAVVELGGDAPAPQRVDFGTGPVQVQLSAGPAGAAIAGRKLRLRAPDLQWSSAESTTDADGMAVVAAVARQAGDVVLEVLEGGTWTPYALDAAPLSAPGPRAVTVPLSR